MMEPRKNKAGRKDDKKKEVDKTYVSGITMEDGSVIYVDFTGEERIHWG